MEKMTFREGDGIACVRDNQCFEEQSGHYCGPAIDRLAAYEDTGMPPEEITAMQHTLDEYHKVADPLLRAQADGRLVVLPCKVGDTVWYEEYGIENGKPVKYGIQPHVVLTHWEYMVAEGKQQNEWLPLGGLGINWFLTREEAEKALEAMK